MKILVDMSLTPLWCKVFTQNGWEAVHWSTIGDHRAPDPIVMEWARVNGHVIFTNDLDFGHMLALANAEGPSVIQVRTHDVLPAHLEPTLIPVMRQYAKELEEGCLLVIEEAQSRIRILPLKEA